MTLLFVSLHFLYNFRFIYLFICTEEDSVIVETFTFLIYYIVLETHLSNKLFNL